MWKEDLNPNLGHPYAVENYPREVCGARLPIAHGTYCNSSMMAPVSSARISQLVASPNKTAVSKAPMVSMILPSASYFMMASPGTGFLPVVAGVHIFGSEYIRPELLRMRDAQIQYGLGVQTIHP